jgi:dTDP-4-dehydrorhamnose 3,5-epimerase
MRFAETDICGAKVIDPSPHEDHRGRFMRAWCVNEFADHGIDLQPVQANMGFSFRKVRGRVKRREWPNAVLTRALRARISDS